MATPVLSTAALATAAISAATQFASCARAARSLRLNALHLG